eukprot:2633381-Pleurochrysis_carterae.AAC.4
MVASDEAGDGGGAADGRVDGVGERAVDLDKALAQRSARVAHHLFVVGQLVGQLLDDVLRHLLAHAAVAVKDAKEAGGLVVEIGVDGDGAVLVDLGNGATGDGLEPGDRLAAASRDRRHERGRVIAVAARAVHTEPAGLALGLWIAVLRDGKPALAEGDALRDESSFLSSGSEGTFETSNAGCGCGGSMVAGGDLTGIASTVAAGGFSARVVLAHVLPILADQSARYKRQK